MKFWDRHNKRPKEQCQNGGVETENKIKRKKKLYQKWLSTKNTGDRRKYINAYN